MINNSLVSVGLMYVSMLYHSYATEVAEASLTAPGVCGELMVYSQRGNDRITAVDYKTKKRKWYWSSKGLEVRVSPTVHNGIAYTWAGTSPKSKAYAIDCRTGKVIWSTSLSGYTFSSAVVCNDIVLFSSVSDDTNTLFALRQSDGELLWKRGHKFLFVYKNIIGVVSNDSSKILLLDSMQGKTVAEFAVMKKNSDPRTTVNSKGIAVFGYIGGLLAIDLNERKELWRIERDKKYRNLPLFVGDRLFVVPFHIFGKKIKLKINELQVKDGKQLDIRKIPDIEISFPKVRCGIDDIVIINESMIYCIPPGKKVFKWKKNIQNTIYQSRIDGGFLLLGGGEGFIEKIDLKEGKTVWRYDLTEGKKGAR